MYDLSRFSLSEMTRCGMELRRLGAGASSMEEVAGQVVRYLYEQIRNADLSEPACALVRMFMTLPYDALDEELRAFTRAMMGSEPTPPALKCLTLLATAGTEPAWNSRRASAGHQALPLVSEQSIARSPMIAQLIRQLGVEVRGLLAADARFVLDAEQHTFNVFYVSEAQGNPHIPAQQQFVIPYRVRSVVGFGGLLPSGEMFATILFSKTPIQRETAELFKPLALSLKLALLPFTSGRIFT